MVPDDVTALLDTSTTETPTDTGNELATDLGAPDPKADDKLLDLMESEGVLTKEELNSERRKLKGPGKKETTKGADKASTDDTSTKPDKGEVEQAKSDTDDAKPALSDEELQSLMQAAQRYKQPKAMQDALAKGDPETIEAARNLAKIQTDFDTLTTDAQTARDELKQLKDAKPEPKSTEAPESFDTSEAAKSLSDVIASVMVLDAEVDGDAITKLGESVGKSFTDLSAKLIEAFEAKLAPILEKADRTSHATLEAHFLIACQPLSEEFPHLKDHDTRLRVFTRMLDSLKSGHKEYGSVMEAAHDATMVELAPALHKEAQKMKAEAEKTQVRQSKARDTNAPDIGDTSKPTPTTDTSESLRTKALELRLEGKEDEAKKLEKRSADLAQKQRR